MGSQNQHFAGQVRAQHHQGGQNFTHHFAPGMQSSQHPHHPATMQKQEVISPQDMRSQVAHPNMSQRPTESGSSSYATRSFIIPEEQKTPLLDPFAPAQRPMPAQQVQAQQQRQQPAQAPQQTQHPQVQPQPQRQAQQTRVQHRPQHQHPQQQPQHQAHQAQASPQQQAQQHQRAQQQHQTMQHLQRTPQMQPQQRPQQAQMQPQQPSSQQAQTSRQPQQARQAQTPQQPVPQAQTPQAQQPHAPQPQPQAQTGHTTSFPSVTTMAPVSQRDLQQHQHVLEVQQQINQASAPQARAPQQPAPPQQIPQAVAPQRSPQQQVPIQQAAKLQVPQAQAPQQPAPQPSPQAGDISLQESSEQKSFSPQFLRSVQALPQYATTNAGEIKHIPQPQLQLAVTAYSKYKLPVVPGIPPRTTLPLGVGLVLEGGGTRGFYSAGVFEAFMDVGIMFPYIAAVSAGAANVLSYVSGQRGRNRIIVERLVSDPRYLSSHNLIKDRSLFNFDFIFKTVPEKYLFWDQDMFDYVQTRLLTGAIDCREGRTVWFEKSQLKPDFLPTIASCSIPLVSKMVRFDNRDLLDGGILDPVPIEKSVSDGNNFHVIVLTQSADYIKSPTRIDPLLKVAYKKYPHLIWAIQERHEAYNRQVALAERLEREGRALIIRPSTSNEISRTESDPEKLLELHDRGHIDGALAVNKLQQIFDF